MILLANDSDILSSIGGSIFLMFALAGVGLTVSLIVGRTFILSIFRNEKMFVIEQISVNRQAARSANIDDPIISIRGREGGLFQLLLSLIGLQSEAKLLLTNREVRVSFSSKALKVVDYAHIIPMQQKPSIEILYRGMNLRRIISYALTSLSLILTCFGIPLGVAILLMAVFLYFFDRSFVTRIMGSSRINIAFQTSLFKSGNITFADVTNVLNELRDTILAASYTQERPTAALPVAVASVVESNNFTVITEDDSLPDYTPPPRQVAPVDEPPPPTTKSHPGHRPGGATIPPGPSAGATTHDFTGLIAVIEDVGRTGIPYYAFKPIVGCIAEVTGAKSTGDKQKAIAINDCYKRVRRYLTEDKVMTPDKWQQILRICDYLKEMFARNPDYANMDLQTCFNQMHAVAFPR